MAIIKPSKKFTGSDIGDKDGGRYILPEVRQVLFNKNSNKEGVYLFFLPAYKVDNDGNGVWYKPFTIRDNFGDKFKDKYVVFNRETDPVSYFERNFRLYYPEEAKPIEEVNEKGQKIKRYPNYGRTTTRVVFNVAYAEEDKIGLGAHVLDLPARNGADILIRWMEEKDSRGRERPLINDPERCIPVFVKLNDGRGATPWQIEPDVSAPCELPLQLADADYLYDLDKIFIKKSEAELIDKLRSMYSAETFDRCMQGYPGFAGVKVHVSSNPIAKKITTPEDVLGEENMGELDMTETPKPTTAKPKVKPAPALTNIPKARIASASAEEDEQDGVEEVEGEAVEKEFTDIAANPLNPSRDEIRKFLSKK